MLPEPIMSACRERPSAGLQNQVGGLDSRCGLHIDRAVRIGQRLLSARERVRLPPRSPLTLARESPCDHGCTGAKGRSGGWPIRSDRWNGRGFPKPAVACSNHARIAILERTSRGDRRRPAKASAPERVSGSYPGLSANRGYGSLADRRPSKPCQGCSIHPARSNSHSSSG